MKNVFYLFLILSIGIMFSCSQEQFDDEPTSVLTQNQDILFSDIDATFTIESNILSFESFNKVDEFQRLLGSMNELKQYEYFSNLYFDQKYLSMYLLFLEEKYRVLSDGIENVDFNKTKYVTLDINNKIIDKNGNHFFQVINDSNIFKVENLYYGFSQEDKLYTSSQLFDLEKALENNMASKHVYDTHFESTRNDAQHKSTNWNGSDCETAVIIDEQSCIRTNRACLSVAPQCEIRFADFRCPSGLGCMWFTIDLNCEPETTEETFCIYTSTASWQVPILDGDNEPGEPCNGDGDGNTGSGGIEVTPGWGGHPDAIKRDPCDEPTQYRHYARITHQASGSNLTSFGSYSYAGNNFTFNGPYFTRTFSNINGGTFPVVHNSTTGFATASDGQTINLSID